MKQVSPKTKRKPGRPATGRDPVLTVRLPPELIADLDACRAVYGWASRSEAIRALLEWGMWALSEEEKRLAKRRNRLAKTTAEPEKPASSPPEPRDIRALLRIVKGDAS